MSQLRDRGLRTLAKITQQLSRRTIICDFNRSSPLFNSDPSLTGAALHWSLCQAIFLLLTVFPDAHHFYSNWYIFILPPKLPASPEVHLSVGWIPWFSSNSFTKNFSYHVGTAMASSPASSSCPLSLLKAPGILSQLPCLCHAQLCL